MGDKLAERLVNGQKLVEKGTALVTRFILGNSGPDWRKIFRGGEMNFTASFVSFNGFSYKQP